MTYEQSLKNLQALINCVRLREKDFVFFEFTSEDKFEVHLLGPQFDDCFPGYLYLEMLECDLPYAQIYWNKDEQEVLFYEDVNGSYWYYLTSGFIEDFSNGEVWRRESDVESSFRIDQELFGKKKQRLN